MNSILAITTALLICLSIFQQVLGSGKPGGLGEGNPNNPEYLELAWNATKSFNQQITSSEYYYIPIQVHKVQLQVVAGMRTVMNVTFVESSCKREEVNMPDITKANCAPQSNGASHLYELDIWEQVWKHFMRVQVKLLD